MNLIVMCPRPSCVWTFTFHTMSTAIYQFTKHLADTHGLHIGTHAGLHVRHTHRLMNASQDFKRSEAAIRTALSHTQ